MLFKKHNKNVLTKSIDGLNFLQKVIIKNREKIFLDHVHSIVTFNNIYSILSILISYPDPKFDLYPYESRSRLRRWKSQRKKIHRLAYRFSIDFKIYRLAYGFLCVNHKGLAKVYRFLVRAFFYQDFKNP
jgi:hypothetical protein